MIKEQIKIADRLNEKYNSKEYKDLVYDLESCIIDMYYPESKENDTGKVQAARGKAKIASVMLDEIEEKRVFETVRPILVELGITPSVKGMRIIERCVIECARLAVENKRYNMSEIYETAGKFFSITPHNAERLARYACDKVRPTRNIVIKYPFLEVLTHRTVENVTVKELCDVLVRYVVVKCKFRQRGTSRQD